MTSRVAVASAIAAVLGMYCALNLHVGTDLTNFMPVGSRSELARVSSRLTDSPFTRTMVVSVGAEETERAIAVASALADALRGHPEVAWVRSSLNETEFADLYELYFPRRHSFLSEEPGAARSRSSLSEQALRERARELRRRLATPASTFLEQPRQLGPGREASKVVVRALPLRRSPRCAGGARPVRHRPTDTSPSCCSERGPRPSTRAPRRRLLDDLHAAFEALAARGGTATVSCSSSPEPTASRSSCRAHHEGRRMADRIGSLTFLGVAAVFFLFVASLRGFIVVSIPPLAGDPHRHLPPALVRFSAPSTDSPWCSARR